ncbi:MAG: formate dehydrogenase accessory sulfurtransferase FdhD [Candidatus Bathyarchaeia archaeon]
MLAEHDVLRFDRINRTFESLKRFVVFEEVIDTYINGGFYASFHCLPTQIKELIVGHLLTEGIIEDVRSIVNIKVSGKSAYIKLLEDNSPTFRGQRLITTFCGGNIQLHLSRKVNKLRFNSIKFDAEAIFKSIEALNKFSSLHKVSGGTHSAALVNGECSIISFAEDIGRHNAVDKVVGDATLKGIDLTKLLLASTGRLTSEIVIKAIHVGIPVLVSLAAPTSLGLKIANNFGLTLIGFARGRYFSIYTFPERIKSVEG